MTSEMLPVMIVNVVFILYLLALIFIPKARPFLIGINLFAGFVFVCWILFQNELASGVQYTFNFNVFSINNRPSVPEGVILNHWIESPFVIIPVALLVFAGMIYAWIKWHFPTVRIEIEQPKEN